MLPPDGAPKAVPGGLPTELREMQAADAAPAARLYNHYVENTTISFEESRVTVEAMRERIVQALAGGHPWLAAFDGEALLGYAYAGPWKLRSAYRYSVESSVYVASGRTSAGVGTALYRALLAALRERGFHRVVAGIALPNEPSVRLHERFGFRKVAHFHEVGFKFGRWLDVGYWECALDRQPPIDA